MSDSEIKILTAGLAAAVTLLVAVFTASVARGSTRRTRRLDMYAQAYRAALEWRELAYRVARRGGSEEEARALVERFHDLQERLTFHEGWIGSESRYLQKSYRKFVSQTRVAFEDPIRNAWESGQINPVWGKVQIDAADPPDGDTFLRDVRAHLSIQPWRRAAVLWRNRK